MLIAETVQFEIPAWFVALVLAILLALLAGVVAFVVVGFRAAERAANGSTTARPLFFFITGIEGFIALYALVQRGFYLFWLVPLIIVALQVFTYLSARDGDAGDN